MKYSKCVCNTTVSINDLEELKDLNKEEFTRNLADIIGCWCDFMDDSKIGRGFRKYESAAKGNSVFHWSIHGDEWNFMATVIACDYEDDVNCEYQPYFELSDLDYTVFKARLMPEPVKQRIVKSSTIEYTGGDIWVAYGEFEDGTFFSGCTNEGFQIYNEPCTSEDYDKEIIDTTDDYTDETFDIWEQIYEQCEKDHYSYAYLDEFRFDLEDCREYAERKNNRVYKYQDNKKLISIADIEKALLERFDKEEITDVTFGTTLTLQTVMDAITERAKR